MNRDNHRLVEATQHELLTFVRRRVNSDDEAQGITQQAYTNFLSAGHDAKSTDARLLLFTIAKHLIHDHHRATLKHSHNIVSDTNESINAAASQNKSPQ